MPVTTPVTIRVARLDDVPALNSLITASGRALSAGFYTPEQIESALRFVFGVDTSLVADGTYLVAEHEGELAGCGGWSRRRALYGGDQRRVGEISYLDPASDAARIRAFFVAPAWARRGVGTSLLEACEAAARDAGFRSLELMATLPGVPLYAARGFEAVEAVVDALPDGTQLPFVRMRRSIEGRVSSAGDP